MKLINSCLVIMIFCFSPVINAQLGIKAGLNLANEIKSFNQNDIKAGFNTNNLTGYQIGLTYQLMPKNSGLGVEIGALLSQKGSSFIDSTSITNTIKEGYSELNYFEIPLSIRYRLKLGSLGLYISTGIYGGYALSYKEVNETANTDENKKISGFIDHLDYGYNFGGGIELFKKIQLGATWSQGLKNTANKTINLPMPTVSTNKVFSVILVYMF